MGQGHEKEQENMMNSKSFNIDGDHCVPPLEKWGGKSLTAKKAREIGIRLQMALYKRYLYFILSTEENNSSVVEIYFQKYSQIVKISVTTI